METADAVAILGQINTATNAEAQNVQKIADGIAAILSRDDVPAEIAEALTALQPLTDAVNTNLAGIASGFDPVPTPTPTPGDEAVA